MNREEAIKNLVYIVNVEPEQAHIEADTILCLLLSELGYDDVIAEYDKIQKWYA